MVSRKITTVKNGVTRGSWRHRTVAACAPESPGERFIADTAPHLVDRVFPEVPVRQAPATALD